MLKHLLRKKNFENPIDIMIFYLTKPENIQPIVDIPQDLNYSLKNKNFCYKYFVHVVNEYLLHHL